MTPIPSAGREQVDLDALSDALGALGAPAVVEQALAEAQPLAASPADLAPAAVVIAGRLLASAAWEATEGLEAGAAAVAAAADAVGVGRDAFTAAVAESAFVDSCTRLLPPLLAARCALDVLRVLGRLRGASLWTRGDGGGIAATCSVGSGGQGERSRRAATAALAGEDPVGGDAVAAVPVLRHGEHVGAIAIRRDSGSHPAAVRLAAACARAVAVALDRSMLLDRRAAAERMLVEAGEHRLRRVGLDLHDGPLQSAAQLAGELRLLHQQAGELELGERDLERLRGRLEDLLGRLTRLDEELRELATSFESPVVLNASFETALADEVAAFERRSGQRAEFTLNGSLEALSPSQRIALYRMLQEALSNVRQHSGAKKVVVTVAAEPAGVVAEIADDGVGFDPNEVLTRTKGRRHLGLAGIRERALLLGGTATVDSRPGGPTRLSIFLPASTSLPGLVDDLVWALGRRERGRGGNTPRPA